MPGAEYRRFVPLIANAMFSSLFPLLAGPLIEILPEGTKTDTGPPSQWWTQG